MAKRKCDEMMALREMQWNDESYKFRKLNHAVWSANQWYFNEWLGEAPEGDDPEQPIAEWVDNGNQPIAEWVDYGNVGTWHEPEHVEVQMALD